VFAASLQANSRTVWLTTSRLAPGAHTLATWSVEDLLGNGIFPYDLHGFAFSAAGSWQGRLSAADDDAEQDIIGLDTDLGSGDLELGFDATVQQLVGLRFRDVSIPAGANLQGASLQFEADEVSSGPATLRIEAEAVDDAAPLQELPNDLGARVRTSSAVDWSPADWLSKGDVGPAQQTPDLSPLLEEIVQRPGWASGNAIVLLVSGTGVRTAESVEGSPAGAPLLSLDYVLPLPACSDGVDNDGDFRTDFPSDPDCDSDEDTSEHPPPPRGWGCGLGVELVVPLGFLLGMHRQRRVRRRRRVDA
jgi:hypothetical protein